jgi:uncharacterized membrane protein
MLSISDIAGRFHPLLVHLPIGILLVALLMLLFSYRQKSEHNIAAIRFLLTAGMISALLSVCTGLMLSWDGGYDSKILTPHMWMGNAVALLSILLVGLFGKWRTVLFKTAAVLLLLAITFTGHLGGSLTHGEDYLFAAMAEETKDSVKQRPPIAEVQLALAYRDVIRPFLEDKCFGCHGAAKQKGRLRMDEFDAMMRGGKNGIIVVPGKPDESEIVKRIELPIDDDHHMSPKKKLQITENELALLKWWIATGASSLKKVNELAQDEKVRARLASLESAPVDEIKEESIIPETPVAAGDSSSISQLRRNGAVVMPISRDGNYLEINFVNDTISLDRQLPLLLKLKAQLLSLKLANKSLSDKGLEELSACRQLVHLNLSHTFVTDAGINSIARLENLRTLNLTGTRVTANGVIKLQPLKKLQKVYLYQTAIRREDWKNLNAAFKNVHLDSGGYQVPFFPSDTMEVIYLPPVKQ